MVLVAYNLLSLFRQGILKQQIQQTLSTIRFKCFALGGWIVKSGRKKVLKLSVAMQRRGWLDCLVNSLILAPLFPLNLIPNAKSGFKERCSYLCFFLLSSTDLIKSS